MDKNNIEDLERAIKHNQKLLNIKENKFITDADILFNQVLKTTLQALEEKLEREKNKPLTIEELKNMMDEPVWHTGNNCWTVIDDIDETDKYLEVIFFSYEECDYVYKADEENSPFYKYKPTEEKENER